MLKKYQLFVTTKHFPNYYRPKRFYSSVEEVFDNLGENRYKSIFNFKHIDLFRRWILVDTSNFIIVARGNIKNEEN